MAARKSRAKPAVKKDPSALTVRAKSEDDKAAALAHASLLPTMQAAVTLSKYSADFGTVDLDTLVDDLREECATASSGDLGRPEATLVAQAHTLDAIFHTLARRAALNMGEYMGACETYLRLALKAQSQCRATLEALGELKRPRSLAFVGQANIAHGPQQVNNGVQREPEPSRAGKFENPPNELLEQSDGERLDAGAAGATGGANPPLEAVGAVDGATNG